VAGMDLDEPVVSGAEGVVAPGLAGPGEVSQARQEALLRLNEYLDQMNDRHTVAQVLNQNSTPVERDRAMSEALGQRNVGNTCYANSAHALLWAMKLRTPIEPEDGVPLAAIRRLSGVSADLNASVGRVLESFQSYLYSGRTAQNPQGHLDRLHPLVGFQHDSPEYLYKVLELLESSPNLGNPTGAFRVAHQSILSDGRTNPVNLGDDLRNRWELPLSAAGGTPSLQDIFDAAMAPAEVEDMVWEQDPAVRLPGQRKTFLIQQGNLPRSALLQLKRFAVDGSKISRRVSINHGIIFNYYSDASQLDGAPSQLRLEIRGGIVHHGNNQNFGHYTAVIRHQGEWFFHDDSRVVAMDQHAALDLLEREGYLFLYDSEQLVSGQSGSESSPLFSQTSEANEGFGFFGRRTPPTIRPRLRGSRELGFCLSSLRSALPLCSSPAESAAGFSAGFVPESAEGRQQASLDAVARLNSYLDELGARYRRVQELPVAHRNRSMSEALGQRNLGNTCYANSAHALLWAMNLRLPADVPPAPQPDLGAPVRGLVESVQGYLSSSRTPQNPWGYLDQAHPLIGFQHDSPEYLYKLLEVFDLNPEQPNPTGAFLMAYQSILADGRSNAVNVGVDRRNRFELSLEPAGGLISLQQVLDQASEPSSAKDIQWDEDPMVRLDGVRKSYLLRDGILPRTFLFQLKRFAADGSKITRRVTADPEVTLSYYEDVAHVHGPALPHRLRLRGVIMHHGASQNFGHYTALIRHLSVEGGVVYEQWFHHDDSRVTPTDTDSALELINRDGYVFLYDSEPAGVARVGVSPQVVEGGLVRDTAGGGIVQTPTSFQGSGRTSARSFRGASDSSSSQQVSGRKRSRNPHW